MMLSKHWRIIAATTITASSIFVLGYLLSGDSSRAVGVDVPSPADTVRAQPTDKYQAVAFEDIEGAIQWTLECMREHGVEPRSTPARGQLPSSIGFIVDTVKTPNFDELYAACSAANDLDRISTAWALRELSASQELKAQARSAFDACIARSGLLQQGRTAERSRGRPALRVRGAGGF